MQLRGEARRLLSTAIGQASSFRLLNEGSESPEDEIKAAKLTGALLDKTLASLWKVLVDDEVKISDWKPQ